MLITRTPYRVSLFGGGTDYPAWFRDHGGRVIASTINRYCYISARWLPPFFKHRSRVVWSKVETINNPSEIEHPSVRACLNHLGITRGIEIHHDGDLPAMSGMGSSSAFTVGLLHALHALEGRYRTHDELAREAIHVEQTVLQEAVGVQDQIEVANGGLNLVDIDRSGNWRVTPIVIPEERRKALEERLLLFFTGVNRHAAEVAKDQIAATPKREFELSSMRKIVDMALIALAQGDLDAIGALLHESWQLKRSLTDKISSENIDDIYRESVRAGAIGGKILGAGGGGFMLIYANQDTHATIRKALTGLIEIPFYFENSGTQIIFCDR